MKKNLPLDFIVNKDDKTILVKKVFAAPVNLVWSAWTEAELLDQWWAPRPWKAETQKMDFKVGGYWLYAMVGPEGERHYGRVDYKSITALQSFLASDGFCNEEGVIDKSMPQNNWENTFTAVDKNTLVTILLSFQSLDDLEKIMAMGFKEGFEAALSNLDELLAK